jgi:hypothetical protein
MGKDLTTAMMASVLAGASVIKSTGKNKQQQNQQQRQPVKPVPPVVGGFK